MTRGGGRRGPIIAHTDPRLRGEPLSDDDRNALRRALEADYFHDLAEEFYAVEKLGLNENRTAHNKLVYAVAERAIELLGATRELTLPGMLALAEAAKFQNGLRCAEEKHALSYVARIREAYGERLEEKLQIVEWRRRAPEGLWANGQNGCAQAIRFESLSEITIRASEGGAFEDLAERWGLVDRWTTNEREVARETWDIAGGILGDDAPVDTSWRVALTALALFGKFEESNAPYFVAMLCCGELPKEHRDFYARVHSHLAWEPRDPRERILDARRRAAATRRVLGLKARHD